MFIKFTLNKPYKHIIREGILIMKLNYADRQNDSNILSKSFKIAESQDDCFRGKITLIQLKKVLIAFLQCITVIATYCNGILTY